MAAPTGDRSERLISNPREAYGDKFQDHVLEQYKLYVDSSQRVSEKRISTGNFLLAVNSSLLTAFGIASTLHIGGHWLLIIPLAGLLVSLTWYSMVKSYKDLNTAKFRVIHELEDHLPAALFRYEWHACDHGRGAAYKPITHLERWIPSIFALVYLALGFFGWFSAPGVEKKVDVQPISVTGSVDVNVRSQAPETTPGAPQKNTSSRRSTTRTH